MAKFRYKNISKKPVTVINYGSVEPGEVIEVDNEINSPDLKLTKSK